MKDAGDSARSMIPESADQAAGAVDGLVNREEVLQICYWYEGEGFGKTFDAQVLTPFLKCGVAAAEDAFRELVRRGFLELAPGPATAYRFTSPGRKFGGRLFSDDFADYQNAGHGECAAGCCDSGDHSRCGDECALH